MFLILVFGYIVYIEKSFKEKNKNIIIIKINIENKGVSLNILMFEYLLMNNKGIRSPKMIK